jgi:hypothetical protein
MAAARVLGTTGILGAIRMLVVVRILKVVGILVIVRVIVTRVGVTYILVVAATAEGRGIGTIEERVINVVVVRVRIVGARVERVVAVIVESVGAGEVGEVVVRIARVVRTAEIEIVVAAIVVRAVGGKGQERG